MIQLLLNSLEKVYNSIKYNGFYIFLALLFPLIIYKFDAGKEIIVSMTETAFWPNLLLSLSAFATLAYCVWCIPTLAIKFFQFIKARGKVQNPKEKLCLFRQLIFVYNGLDKDDNNNNQSSPTCISTSKKKLLIPMRYFSITPWILFVATCIKVFFSVDYIWLFTIGMLILLFALIFLIDHFKEYIVGIGKWLFTDKETRCIRPWRLILIPLLMLIAIITAWVIFAVQHKTGTEVAGSVSPVLMIILHSLVMLLFYSFLVYMENEKFDRAEAYRISNISYKAAILFIAGGILAFYFANESQVIEFVSPVNVIIIICAALIIFFEFFFTSQHMLITIVQKICEHNTACALAPEGYDKSKDQPSEMLRGYRYSLYIVLTMLLYQFFFSSVNEHRIRVEESATEFHPKRDSLNVYFDRWFRTRNISRDDSVVYLVSGQGGGSRAAAHFFMTMARLQSRNPDFFKKVFCISTASGSTSGAEMFLASRFYGRELHNDSAIEVKGKQLYGRNYMSSAFFGMLAGDGLEYFTSGNSTSVHDRNYHLQKEELVGFKAAFDTNDNKFFERDYMYAYQDTNRHWPLFMINTTVVDYGVRGVYSPVLPGYGLARDLYGDFSKDNHNAKKDLPLVTCVNQSQAFPLLSAYNYQQCTGRLADGGVVENTGCASTLEVYEALRSHCNNTGRKNITIVCLNLYNSSLAEDFYAPFKNASILNTVTAAANSPFSGAQFYAYKNLSKKIAYLNRLGLDINTRDTVIDFGLDTSITLTRTLSRNAVKKIFNDITGKYQPAPNRWDKLVSSLRRREQYNWPSN